MCTKLVSTKIIFIDRGALMFTEPFIYNQHCKQKMTDVTKEKLSPLVEEYRRINRKPK